MGSKDKKSKEEGKKKKKKEESEQEEDDDDSQKKKKKKSKKGTIDSDDEGKKDKGKKKKKKSKTVDYVEIYENELRNYEPDKVENYEDEYHKKKGKTLHQTLVSNIRNQFMSQSSWRIYISNLNACNLCMLWIEVGHLLRELRRLF